MPIPFQYGGAPTGKITIKEDAVTHAVTAYIVEALYDVRDGNGALIEQVRVEKDFWGLMLPGQQSTVQTVWNTTRTAVTPTMTVV